MFPNDPVGTRPMTDLDLYFSFDSLPAVRDFLIGAGFAAIGESIPDRPGPWDQQIDPDEPLADTRTDEYDFPLISCVYKYERKGRMLDIIGCYASVSDLPASSIKLICTTAIRGRTPLLLHTRHEYVGWTIPNVLLAPIDLRPADDGICRQPQRPGSDKEEMVALFYQAPRRTSALVAEAVVRPDDQKMSLSRLTNSPAQPSSTFVLRLHCC